MANLFSGLSGNIKFPEVVMNSGPLPPENGLPAPLHSDPDGRINYNSTLLGDVTPYTSLGEPGYLSSQAGYLNIPHRIQKIIPPLHLPEPDGMATFKLSHGVDDSDLAFVMRLCRHSIFCTGNRTSTQRNGLGTNIDPFINLCTLNYILACIQMSVAPEYYEQDNLWWEFLYNLDSDQWPKDQSKRDYTAEPLTFTDLQHIVQHCIKPFGIVRGSERQGGQTEMSLGPATWPTSFVAAIVIDGKEANVVNVWHNKTVNANDDLVLRFMPKKCGTYVLNHYYKGYASKHVLHPTLQDEYMVWQLVPDVKNLDIDKTDYQDFFQEMHTAHRATFALYNQSMMFRELDLRPGIPRTMVPWQSLGYWHIGRSQVMIHRYGVDDFYKNDMANNLRTNHLQMTVQPMWYGIRYPWQSAHSPPPSVAKSFVSKSMTQLEMRVKKQKTEHIDRGWIGAMMGNEGPTEKRESTHTKPETPKMEPEALSTEPEALSTEPGFTEEPEPANKRQHTQEPPPLGLKKKTRGKKEPQVTFGDDKDIAPERVETKTFGVDGSIETGSGVAWI